MGGYVPPLSGCPALLGDDCAVFMESVFFDTKNTSYYYQHTKVNGSVEQLDLSACIDQQFFGEQSSHSALSQDVAEEAVHQQDQEGFGILPNAIPNIS